MASPRLTSEALSLLIDKLSVKGLIAFIKWVGERPNTRCKQTLKQRAVTLCCLTNNPLSLYEKLKALQRFGGGSRKSRTPIARRSSRIRPALLPTPAAAADSTTGLPAGSNASRKSPDLEVWPYTPPVVNFPRHPDVKFKPLPFHSVIAELVKPSSLTYQSISYLLGSTFSFTLTPQQTAMLINSQNVRTGEYGVQVLLRFCLLETTSVQDDHYPPGLTVWVNSTLASIQAPPNKVVGHDYKRTYQPVDITYLTKLDPFMANTIQINTTPHFNRYVAAIYLVSKKSPECLISSLPTRVAFYTKGMIVQKLKEDMDSEIATTCLRVSLMCPLGKMRIINPCRALTCDHVQCFDASLYIKMNEKKTTWLCPVCDKSAPYENLVIDNYFVDVLKSSVLPCDCNEIQLLANGDWIPLTIAGPSAEHLLHIASTSKTKLEASVTLSSDDDCAVVDEKFEKKKVKRQPKVQEIQEIDLLSSESDASISDSEDSSRDSILPFKKRKTANVLRDIYNNLNSPSNQSIIVLDSDDPPEFEISPAGSPKVPVETQKDDSSSMDDVPLATIAKHVLNMPSIDSPLSPAADNSDSESGSSSDSDVAEKPSTPGANIPDSVQPHRVCTVSLSDLKVKIRTTAPRPKETSLLLGSDQSKSVQSQSIDYGRLIPQCTLSGASVDDLKAGNHSASVSLSCSTSVSAVPPVSPFEAVTSSSQRRSPFDPLDTERGVINYSQATTQAEDDLDAVEFSPRSSNSPYSPPLDLSCHSNMAFDSGPEEVDCRPTAPDLRRNPLSCSSNSLPSPLPPLTSLPEAAKTTKSASRESSRSPSPNISRPFVYLFSKNEKTVQIVEESAEPPIEAPLPPSPDPNPTQNPFYCSSKPSILRKAVNRPVKTLPPLGKIVSEEVDRPNSNENFFDPLTLHVADVSSAKKSEDSPLSPGSFELSRSRSPSLASTPSPPLNDAGNRSLLEYELDCAPDSTLNRRPFRSEPQPSSSLADTFNRYPVETGHRPWEHAYTCAPIANYSQFPIIPSSFPRFYRPSILRRPVPSASATITSPIPNLLIFRPTTRRYTPPSSPEL